MFLLYLRKMKSRLIIGAYLSASGVVAGTNILDYQPKNLLLNSFWNLLNINTNYGRTTAFITVAFAPFLIPVFGISLPLLRLYEWSHSKFNQDTHNQNKTSEYRSNVLTKS
jgi:hypothetical protein